MHTFTVRVMIVAGVLQLLVATNPAAAQQSFSTSYALVVGINRYDAPDWPPLRYAVKDAAAMADFLGSRGFRVTALYDAEATRSAILGHLTETIAPRLQPNDRVLVFFAGHGGTRESAGREHGFIVPVDGGRGFGTNIEMDELRTASIIMDTARHMLFIMDACYGGLLAATRGSKVADAHPAYLNEITRRRARQVLTAGGADQQVADGGPGGHSYFTYHLLQALEKSEADLNGDGYITFAELAAYIVPVAHTFRQTPTYSTLTGHRLGEFVFRSGYKVRAPPAPPPRINPTPMRGSVESEVKDLVRRFFEANNDEDVGALLGMFSDTVDYFGWGDTPPGKIRGDKRSFFKRWPDVEYTPVGEPNVAIRSNRSARMRIKFDFYVRSMERCEAKHGESSFNLGLERSSGSWKIRSIKEKVYYRNRSFNPC